MHLLHDHNMHLLSVLYHISIQFHGCRYFSDNLIKKERKKETGIAESKHKSSHQQRLLHHRSLHERVVDGSEAKMDAEVGMGMMPI